MAYEKTVVHHRRIAVISFDFHGAAFVGAGESADFFAVHRFDTVGFFSSG